MENLKIQFLKSHPEFAYFVGDNAELPADKVSELVQSGHVILFPGETEKEENPLPIDLPCRDILFESGYTSIKDLVIAGDSITRLAGINKKQAEKIKQFISEIPEK